MTKRVFPVVLVALLALAAWAASPQVGDQSVIGPYVQWVTQDSARICWATPSGAVKATAEGEEVKAVGAYSHHEVVLDRLTPGTTYRYEVPGVPGGTGTFTTVPQEDEPFTFAIIGDTRSGHETHRKVVDMVMAQKPAFVVNTGDLVRDGRHLEDWEIFFDINRELMRGTPYYPVLGNHEKDARFYFDFFSLPGNERYYSLDRAGLHMVFLDNYGPRLPGVDTKTEPGRSAQWRLTEDFLRRQSEWLRADLAAHQEAAFRIVFMHQGPWTAKESRVEDSARVRARFGRILEEGRVDAVINGHDHYYLRLENRGIMYVTAAGGGAGLYDPTAPLSEVDQVYKRAKVHHYMIAQVDKGVIKFTVTDVEGNVIDAFELQAKAREATP